jgi:DNA-binding Lrp family transcriptional regulator
MSAFASSSTVVLNRVFNLFGDGVVSGYSFGLEPRETDYFYELHQFLFSNLPPESQHIEPLLEYNNGISVHLESTWRDQWELHQKMRELAEDLKRNKEKMGAYVNFRRVFRKLAQATSRRPRA